MPLELNLLLFILVYDDSKISTAFALIFSAMIGNITIDEIAERHLTYGVANGNGRRSISTAVSAMRSK